MVENIFKKIVAAASPLVEPKAAEEPASRQPDVSLKHEPILDELDKPKKITFRELISPEQIEWIEALGEEAQEAYALVVEELEKIDEIKNFTDEEIISRRVKPYLKKIFRLKIRGERGFTEKDREYVIQAAVSKIKFKRPKAL